MKLSTGHLVNPMNVSYVTPLDSNEINGMMGFTIVFNGGSTLKQSYSSSKAKDEEAKARADYKLFDYLDMEWEGA